MRKKSLNPFAQNDRQSRAMTNHHTVRDKLIVHLKIWLLFLLFTLVMLYPCNSIFSIWNKIQSEDASFFAWCIAWIQRSVLHSPGQLFHANILHPLPYSLAYTAALYTPAFLSLPIRLFTENPVFIYNVMVYLSFIIAGTGAFYFVRRTSGSTYGAILGGFIFAFCSQRLWRANGHLNILQSCWIPYFYLALHNFYQSPKWKNGIFVGLLLIALILGCLYSTVIAAAGAVLLTIYWLATKQFRITSQLLLRLAIVSVSVAVIAYPFIRPYSRTGETRFNIIDDLIEHSATVNGYFIPPHQPYFCITLIGLLFHKAGAFEPKGDDIEFLGYSVLCLALIEICLALYFRSPHRSSIFYGCFGLVFFILSFGPYLKIKEHVYSFPLPYYFIYKYVHLVNFMRAVSRYSTLVFLALGVLIANLWSRKFFQTEVKWKALAFFLVALVIIALEYFSLSFATIHTFEQTNAYAYLKTLPEDTVVLDLSASGSNVALNSTLHWKKIIGGAYFPTGYLQDYLAMTQPEKLTWLLYNKYNVGYLVCDSLDTYEKFSTIPYFQKVVPEVPRVLKFVSPHRFNTIETVFREKWEKESMNEPQPVIITREAYQRCSKSPSIEPSKENPFVYRTTRKANVSELPISPFAPAALPKISVMMRAKSSADTRTTAALYWSTPQLPWSNEENTIYSTILLDNRFHTYTLDMSSRWQWVAASKIIRLRFDPVAGRNIEFEIQEIRLHH